MQTTRVGIIGTGITALSIGYYLPIVNPDVQIIYFDKASKVGGRVATRRSRENQSVLFDHGSPYLHKSHLKGDFSKVLEKLSAIQEIKMNFAKFRSLKQQTPSKTGTQRVIIGNDGFDSITSSIKKSLKNVSKYLFNCKVQQICLNQNEQMSVVYQQNSKNHQYNQLDSFHRVFCCIPFPQAKQLVQNMFSFEAYKDIKSAYHAKWVVMVTTKKGVLFKTYKDTDVIDFSQCQDSPIKYAVKQNKKFKEIEKADKQNWTFYFSQEWTQKNLKFSKQEVEELFVKSIIGDYLTEGSKDLKFQFLKAHRWLYSSPKLSNPIEKSLISQDKRLIFTGDWVRNRQTIGECWQLGKEIVQQLYESKELEIEIIKSKL